MGSVAGADAAAGGAAGPGAGSVVARPRLFGRLAARARVSVVSAPTGSGKTVFVGRGASDEFFRGQPEELMQHLTAPVTLASFTDAEGAGAASAVIWTTRGLVNDDDPSDTALRQVGTADRDGVAGSAA